MPSILATVTGPDRPGITAGLLSALAASDAEVLDMEQVVLRGRLHLGIEFSAPEGTGVIKDLLYLGWQQGVQVAFEVLDDGVVPAVGSGRHVVSVIGHRLAAGDLGAVTEAIAGAGANIDRIHHLAQYPVRAYEFEVEGGDGEALRTAVLAAAIDRPIDVAVQRQRLERRAKRLVVMDVDSTLITDEVIDLLAEEAGVGEQVAKVTAAAMAGELDFAEALAARVALLEGLPVERLEAVWQRITLTPGARTFVRTVRRLGYDVAIVSGGFSYFTDRLREELDLDHAHANVLEVVDGRLSGRVVGDVVDSAGKADLLAHIADHAGVPLEQTVAIGDGANDLAMLAAAGLGIAFNAKPVVAEAADTAVNVPYLDAVLFLLGIRRTEVEEVPGADGPPI
ncbi:MAG: phosphoserine phosphatase SerB [Acidimicrobiia bacterium]